ncbi:hypothetical protein MP638_006796 [Amoeboaphelidium occidentale]|nr:hypothetical protein MP638_006796 [Amoeboaphelidium occidentale]
MADRFNELALQSASTLTSLVSHERPTLQKTNTAETTISSTASSTKKGGELSKTMKKFLFSTDAANLINDPNAVEKICDVRRCILKDETMEQAFLESTVVARMRSQAKVFLIAFVVELIHFVMLGSNLQWRYVVSNALISLCMIMCSLLFYIAFRQRNAAFGEFIKRHFEWVTFILTFIAASTVNLCYNAFMITRPDTPSTVEEILYQLLISNALVIYCMGIAIDISIIGLCTIVSSNLVLLLVVALSAMEKVRNGAFIVAFFIYSGTLLKSMAFTILCKFRVKISDRMLFYQKLFGADGDIDSIKRTAVDKEAMMVRDSFDMPAPSIKDLVRKDSDDAEPKACFEALRSFNGYILTPLDFNVFFEDRVRNGAFVSLLVVFIIDILLGFASLLLGGRELYTAGAVKISIFAITLVGYFIAYKLLIKNTTKDTQASVLTRRLFNILFNITLLLDSVAFIVEIVMMHNLTTVSIGLALTKICISYTSILSNVATASAIGIRPGWFLLNAFVTLILMLVPMLAYNPSIHSEDYTYWTNIMTVQAIISVIGGACYGYIFVRHLTKLWYHYWDTQRFIMGYRPPH